MCVSVYIFLRNFSCHQFSGTETFIWQKGFPSMGINCLLPGQAALSSHHTDKMVGMLNQASSPNWELRWALVWIISILSSSPTNSSVLYVLLKKSFTSLFFNPRVKKDFQLFKDEHQVTLPLIWRSLPIKLHFKLLKYYCSYFTDLDTVAQKSSTNLWRSCTKKQ